MTKEVRTRFAPSPTGFVHIGNFRSAVYAWLLARHLGGKFVLRVEDTDQERKVPGAIKYVLECFDWLGVDLDEGPTAADFESVGEPIGDLKAPGGPHGPYIQSQRLSRYKEVAQKLIETGFAYRCDCTPEMLEEVRKEQQARKELPGYGGRCRGLEVSADTKHVVRFKMPHKPTIVVEDAIKGRVAWESVPMRDPVLLKSDGFPTYHLAVVCDDHDMEISHILRADEWLPSVPLHVLLYQALGWEPPQFCHLPQVLGSDGKKLSKRHGSTAVMSFKDEGYQPEAVLNYMVLVGWSPGDGEQQEIFSKEELIEKFSLDHVNKASAVFDYTKLGWMNGMYIRKLSFDEFTRQAMPLIEAAGMKMPAERWQVMAPHIQERLKFMKEVPEMVDFLCQDDIKRDLDAMYGKGVDVDKATRVLERCHAVISELTDFTHEALDLACRKVAEDLGLKPGPAFGVLRIAITGKKVSPPLFESIVALGKTEALKRLDDTLKLI